jgi:hypothetical protein
MYQTETCRITKDSIQTGIFAESLRTPCNILLNKGIYSWRKGTSTTGAAFEGGHRQLEHCFEIKRKGQRERERQRERGRERERREKGRD